MLQNAIKIGLLTCEKLPLLTAADQKVQQLLNAQGYIADALIWDDSSIDWMQYGVLVFRNTWDYFEKEEAFMQWLSMIESNCIKTLNPISVIRRNIHKFYLRSLEEKGIRIIPTLFVEKNTTIDIAHMVGNRWDRIVIKPAFSAGSYLTTLADKSQFDSINAQYTDIGKTKDLMIQAYMPEITTSGETSLLYFNNEFSHAVCKVPANGDFRVQSQFGGLYHKVVIHDDIRIQAENALDAFGVENVLYARVDGIVIGREFYLMEIELIEPDLYLDHQESAYQQFTDAIISNLMNDHYL